MFKVSSLVALLLGPMLCILAPHSAMAQQSGESGVAYETARNMVGLLRYCRGNRLLDPVVAGKAIAVLEAELGEPPAVDSAARERGDRSQQAGEDGIWAAGGGRDIASAAKLLYRSDPEDLCRGWAEGTMSVKQGGGGKKTSIAAVAPGAQDDLPARADRSRRQPEQADRPAAAPIIGPDGAEVIIIAPAEEPVPPLPGRSPFRQDPTETVVLPLGSTPTSSAFVSAIPGDLGRSDGKPPAVGASAARPPAALQGAQGPGSPRPDPSQNEAPPPPPGGTALSAAAATPSVWDNWPLNRLGRTGRCLMAGCKWSPARQRPAL